MKQTILKAFPPNFAEIVKAFPWVKGQQGVLYSWGDHIYNPQGVEIPPELLAHEAVHGERQGEHVGNWWACYLEDPHFRLMEEILAHRAEWRARLLDRPGFGLKQIAARLSGPLYGNLISYEDAAQAIREEPLAHAHA